jgi:hypothetical protein
MAHSYNPTYKMDWRHGSSGRVPSCAHEALSSNPNPTKKKQTTFLGRILHTSPWVTSRCCAPPISPLLGQCPHLPDVLSVGFHSFTDSVSSG